MTTGPGGAPEPDVRDRELLAAHVAGDPDAFGALVTAHRDRLWAVALRTLGDRDEAADALESRLDRDYDALVPADRTLEDAFRRRLDDDPDAFAPV